VKSFKRNKAGLAVNTLSPNSLNDLLGSRRANLSLLFGAIVMSLVLLTPQIASADKSNSSQDVAGAATNQVLQGPELRAAMDANPEQAKAVAIANGVHWCQTQIVYDRRTASLNDATAACPILGDCDIVANRDAAIPLPGTPNVILRLKFNVFRNDDGSNAVATQADVDAQVVQLNIDFAPSGIEFEYTTEFINNTAFRNFSEFEEGGMKNTYADKPDEQLNVFVASVNAGWIGVGTFPWDPVALGNMGGIIVHAGTFGAGAKTLTHEVGHNLGLWHTHHGVSEVAQCGPCYEAAGGASDGNTTGDLCADTDPTPTNFSCSPPGGVDGCNGFAWGATDTQNYMGYAPDNCYSEFSPHQFGRMHCWTVDILSTWQSGVNFTADTTFGKSPLDVAFAGTTNKNVTDWSWDFGDGTMGTVQSPSHQFGPGVRDILVDIQSTEGPYSALKRNFIAAYADTMSVVEVEGGAGDTVEVQIYARNYLPLSQIRIPFAWGGPLNLEYIGESTVGLRTEYVANQGLSDIDPIFNFRGTYVITPNITGGEVAVAPGTGSVLTLKFRIPPGSSGGPNTISLPTYGANSPNFVYGSRLYLPQTNSAPVSVCVSAGDADGTGSLNIADVTYLIDLIFNGGPPSVPANAGDADCGGSVNIGDVTFLIAFIFNSGAAPCSCAP
jgi:Pregnancy-associated plasma protein-A